MIDLIRQRLLVCLVPLRGHPVGPVTKEQTKLDNKNVWVPHTAELSGVIYATDAPAWSLGSLQDNPSGKGHRLRLEPTRQTSYRSVSRAK
ncbi:unnamed protein product [Zymoseptoria tritici ST99CH_3D7]|uniref:Uncharacterized protein n=1 Tax=Zymoseptoria tritici (strain ST99CH_3D7) TaxID=1276538 RepID=A0A1X7RVB4_ZYMT9|nr:unnamed protein product [Zymoseptoria tritici ST99CH_3D7]